MGKRNRRRQLGSSPSGSTNDLSVQQQRKQDNLRMIERKICDLVLKVIDEGSMEERQRMIHQGLSILGFDIATARKDHPFSDADQSKLKHASVGITKGWRFLKDYDAEVHQAALAMFVPMNWCKDEPYPAFFSRLKIIMDSELIGRILNNWDDDDSSEFVEKDFFTSAHGDDDSKFVGKNFFTFAHDGDGLSIFALFCALGNASMVEQIITKTTCPGSAERRKLLEQRETSFHLSPLNIAISNVIFEETGDYEKVARTLLLYGANPFARDILGRTVVHHATDPLDPSLEDRSDKQTCQMLEMAGYCILASKHYHHVGKTVELVGMPDETLNGEKALCEGFDVESGQYAVYLSDSDTQRMLVNPENVRPDENNDDDADKTTTKAPLVDAVDRYGNTALMDVAGEKQRDDFAAFLLDQDADMDIGAPSPRALACAAPLYYQSASQDRPVHRVIKKHIAKLDRKTDVKVCAYCNEPESGEEQFCACSKCMSVWYCSRKCQKKHHPMHKLQCSVTKVVLGSRTPLEMSLCQTVYNFVESKNTQSLKGGYRRPRGVAVNEKFELRITSCPEMFLLCRDTTNEKCCFVIMEDSPGFKEISEIVHPEQTWKSPGSSIEDMHDVLAKGAGCNTKSRHFYASFDEMGDCSVYLGSSWC